MENRRKAIVDSLDEKMLYKINENNKEEMQDIINKLKDKDYILGIELVDKLIDKYNFSSIFLYNLAIDENNNDLIEYLKKRILESYIGHKISDNELDDYEILETINDRVNNYIVFKNIESGIITKLNINSNLNQTNRHPFLLTFESNTYDDTNDWGIQVFYILDELKKKNIVKQFVECRKSRGTVHMERAYFNVNTKYGDYSLCTEYYFNHNANGLERTFTLLKGNIEECREKYFDEYDYNKYLVFRFRLFDNFMQYRFGYCDGAYENMEKNRYYYNGEQVYAASEAFDWNRDAFVVLENTENDKKITDYEKYTPVGFNYDNQFKLYDNLEGTAKICFIHNNRMFYIVKNGYKISLNGAICFRSPYGEFVNMFNSDLDSDICNRFSEQDILNIISVIDGIPSISSDEYRKARINKEDITEFNFLTDSAKEKFINELWIYGNFKFSDDLSIKDKISDRDSYESYIMELFDMYKIGSLGIYIEKLIEEWAERCNLSVADFLGDAYQPKMGEVKKLKRDSNVSG